MGLSAYRNLLGQGRVRLLLISMLINGVAMGLAPALVLVVEEVDDLAAAGLVLGSFAVCTGLSSPARGRLVDRLGQTRVLVPLALAHTAILLAFALAAESEAAVASLAVLAGAAGATVAPMGASVRALWKEIASDERELESAYSLHAVVNELLFIIGPLVVAASIVVASPVAALVVVAICELSGVLLFAASPLSRSWRSAPRSIGRLGALASAGMRTLVLANVGYGMVFGVLDVAVPAFAVERGAPASAGLALAALAVGSAIGGLAYGARTWRTSLEIRMLGLSALTTVALLPLALAQSTLALVVLMAVGGLAVAPFVAAEFGMIDRVAPSGTATEALTWIVTTYAIGSAIGAVAGGAIAEYASVNAALLAAAGGSALAFAVTAARLSTLRPTRSD